MRVNIYAEEMTDRVEIIAKDIDGKVFTGLRFYLSLPTTITQDSLAPIAHLLTAEGRQAVLDLVGQQLQGPFLHHPGDDDSSAVTFWGKRDLRIVLRKALLALDNYYNHTALGTDNRLRDADKP